MENNINKKVLIPFLNILQVFMLVNLLYNNCLNNNFLIIYHSNHLQFLCFELATVFQNPSFTTPYDPPVLLQTTFEILSTITTNVGIELTLINFINYIKNLCQFFCLINIHFYCTMNTISEFFMYMGGYSHTRCTPSKLK